MSRRVVVAQQPWTTAGGERLVVPVALARDPSGGFTFSIELAAPLAAELTIDAAATPADFEQPATRRGSVTVHGARNLLRLSIGNAAGEWLVTGSEARLETDDPLDAGGWIEIVRGGERLVMRLPALRPRLSLEAGDVALGCEALDVDLEAARVRLRYRARASLGTESAVVLMLEDGARPEQLAFAVERDLAEDPDAAELCAARVSLAREPELPFVVYVRVAAELMEPSVDRARLLAAVGLSEDRWLAEESLWLERMGNEAMDGDPSLALAYGELFAAERTRLGNADEDRTLEDYARIRVELERLGDPERVLAEHRLSLPAWFRLDEHWENEAQNPEIAARLEQLLALEHERIDRREHEEERAGGG